MTEFTVIRCDNCGQQEEGQAHGGKGPQPRGWFTISQPLLTVQRLPSEHDFAVWHMCTMECMAVWAHQRLVYFGSAYEEAVPAKPRPDL